MRRDNFLISLLFNGALHLIIISLLLTSCNKLNVVNVEKGVIECSFSTLQNGYFIEEGVLKSGLANMDTNNFILSIFSSSGEKIYDGVYSKRPEEIVVAPGEYTVQILSKRFVAPEFSTPIIGDSRNVLIGENDRVSVLFNCRQTNVGLKLLFTDEFKTQFVDDNIAVSQSDVRVPYSYNENRYLYLQPKEFDILYEKGGVDTLLLRKVLQSGQMVNMTLSYNSSLSSLSKFKIEIDTTRDWVNENYNVGLKIPTGVYSIEEAKNHVGEKNISVFGYIYGGDATTNSVRIYPPFQSKSSIVIAPTMAERDRNNTFVVELPTGKVRDDLNLVNNYYLLGRAVVVTGEIVASYYGYIGIKGVKSYLLL